MICSLFLLNRKAKEIFYNLVWWQFSMEKEKKDMCALFLWSKLNKYFVP